MTFVADRHGTWSAGMPVMQVRLGGPVRVAGRRLKDLGTLGDSCWKEL